MSNKPSKMQQRLAAGKGGRVSNPPTYGLRAIVRPAHEVAKEKAEEEAILNAPKKVTFMSRTDAMDHVYRDCEVLISISDTKTAAPTFKHPPQDMLELHFNDHVTYLDEGLGLRWMMMEDGKAIAEFVAKHTDKRNIIVHCNYGESRSKAVAMAIAAFTDRRVLRVNSWGKTQAYREGHDKGNSRVFTITCDALLYNSEMEAA